MVRSCQGHVRRVLEVTLPAKFEPRGACAYPGPNVRHHVEEDSALLCGSPEGSRNTYSDGGIAALQTAAFAEFGDHISGSAALLFQIWSNEWESWLDLRCGEEVPAMSKVQVLPQLEDLSQVCYSTVVLLGWMHG